jgi:hypothetical protein
MDLEYVMELNQMDLYLNKEKPDFKDIGKE